jgi:hypothetical protein
MIAARRVALPEFGRWGPLSFLLRHGGLVDVPQDTGFEHWIFVLKIYFGFRISCFEFLRPIVQRIS